MTSHPAWPAPARRAAVIGNLRSRQTARLFATAQRLLVEGGIAIAEWHTVRDGAGLRRLVAQAVRRGFEVVIVAGGTAP